MKRVKRRVDVRFKEEILAALDTVPESESCEGLTVRQEGIQALLRKFRGGDIKAFEVIRDTVGEKPVLQREQEPEEETVFVFRDIDAQTRG